MARSPHPPVVAAAVLYATLGCGTEAAPQLVAGQVAGGKGEAAAWSGERRAARAALDDEGRFLLALPAGATYRLELTVSGASAAVLDVATGAPVALEVCAPEALIDLGAMRPEPGCPTHTCLAARATLEACVQGCQVALDCPAAIERDCREAPDPNGCAAIHPCTDPAKGCGGEACAHEQSQVDVDCASPAVEACDPGALVWVGERPVPASLGCAAAGGTR